MARYQLPIFMTILNDSAYGSEYHQFGAKGMNTDLSILSDVNFAAVASALGCRSAEVRTPAEMEKAVGDFLARPRPYVVDARVSKQVVSTSVRRLHYGIES
jgi:acetolactate synthase-1/2/3 large subunit